jgi:hypothetical protein
MEDDVREAAFKRIIAKNHDLVYLVVGDAIFTL